MTWANQDMFWQAATLPSEQVPVLMLVPTA
jgi:hypothetical protein